MNAPRGNLAASAQLIDQRRKGNVDHILVIDAFDGGAPVFPLNPNLQGGVDSSSRERSEGEQATAHARAEGPAS